MKVKLKEYFGKIGNFFKYLFFIILGIIVIYYIWNWYTYNYTNNEWTLIISSTETPNVNFNTKRLEGIETKESCYTLAPQHTPKGGSWECVRGNLYEKYGFDVWKEVCSATGCKK